MTPFHTKVASTSPTADLITRIRNGNMRRKDFVICRTSGLGKGILEALWREGFIFGYQVLENEQESKVYLKYSEGDLSSSRFVWHPSQESRFMRA